LWVAPGAWFLVGAEAAGWHDIVTRVAETGGALSELSHARTVFRIAAGPAQDILAKDCPLDLRPASFAPGYCAQSILAGVGMLVHYLADGRHIDIYVARSYGQFIHAWLQDAALSL
ncbi:MAG: hypothetical protein H8E30_09015, partial [Alphaproteobacteria bacterium]|nr:hypothetical protein [Alphaproteobacteria bacterium]